MTPSQHRTGDEGREAPHVAPLLDQRTLTSETILALLVTEFADAVVLADADGRIAFWNEAATRLFGFTAIEAIGRSLDLIIPERFRDRHWSGYQQVMASGRTSYGDRLLEVPALHRDGRSLSIAFTVTLLRRPDSRRPFAIAAVIRDDTQRWQERRQLRAEIAELRSGGVDSPHR